MINGRVLESHLRSWVCAHPQWRHSTASDVAQALASDVDFQELRLAAWLRSPEGVLIEHVVRRILPPHDRVAIALLTEAVQLAAQQRTRRARLLTAGVGLLVCATVIGLANRP